MKGPFASHAMHRGPSMVCPVSESGAHAGLPTCRLAAMHHQAQSPTRIEPSFQWAPGAQHQLVRQQRTAGDTAPGKTVLHPPAGNAQQVEGRQVGYFEAGLFDDVAEQLPRVSPVMSIALVEGAEEPRGGWHQYDKGTPRSEGCCHCLGRAEVVVDVLQNVLTESEVERPGLGPNRRGIGQDLLDHADPGIGTEALF